MANNILTTVQSEIYDGSNVRTGFFKPVPAKSMSYQEARYEKGFVSPASGTPLVPVDKDVNLINTVVEYFCIYTYGELKISVNGLEAQVINGYFMMTGAAIISVTLTNESSNTVYYELVQGDETVTGD